MSANETVEVRVADLEALRRISDAVETTSHLHAVLAPLIAAIPKPPWEPSDDMVQDYCARQGWDFNGASRISVEDNLKTAYAVFLKHHLIREDAP